MRNIYDIYDLIEAIRELERDYGFEPLDLDDADTDIRAFYRWLVWEAR